MATAPAPSKASGGTSKSTTTKSTAKRPTKAGGTKTKAPRKTKKPGSTKSQATSAVIQAYAAARAAQMDLASIRNDEAARLTDPFWYKAEDILPSVADDTFMSENAKFLPEQIKIVDNALEKNNMSRSDVTPQAFACLLEQARRFALETLTDSQDYASVAGRTEIDRSDVMLANEFRPDHPISVSTQLPKLNLLAQKINREPLPPIPTHCYSGVVLPPKHHQLTARTFDVVTSAQTARRMVQAAPPPPHKLKIIKKKSNAGTNDKHKPSYGASRGRQISVNLKTKKPEEPKNSQSEKIGLKTTGGSGSEPVKMDLDTKEEHAKDTSVGTTSAAPGTTTATSTTAATVPTDAAKKDQGETNEGESDVAMRTSDPESSDTPAMKKKTTETPGGAIGEAADATVIPDKDAPALEDSADTKKEEASPEVKTEKANPSKTDEDVVPMETSPEKS